MSTRFVIALLLIFVVSLVASPVVAQQSNGNDLPSENEVLRIVTNGFEGEIEKVRAWLNSDRASQYPDLQEQARNWVDEIEQENQEIEEDLSGSERISENVQVVGYEFDRENETVQFAIEVERSTTVTLQDVGGTVSGEGFQYRSEVLNSGTHRFQMEAVEANVNGQYTQAIAIADADAERGNTISRTEDAGTLFNEIEWWMIPLASVSGAGAIVLMIIRHIRNLENEGVNQFIPLR